jgi:phosphatidylinositol-4,5-bisphosphate 3-kinase
MLTRVGEIFHIDFGHILGNVKTKFGITRERQPFVFTPQMALIISDEVVDFATVLNSEDYIKFEGMCCQAYNKLRQKGNLLITLFSLMLPAYLPELKDRQKDISYLRKALDLEMSFDEANNHFRSTLKDCLKNSFTRVIDYQAHIFKHKHD